MRFLKWFNKPTLVMFLIMGIGFSSVVAIQHKTIIKVDEQNQAAKQQSIDSDYKTCLSGNLLRSSLRQVVEQSSRGAGIPNPRAFPEFALMDRGDQDFWLAFVAVLNNPQPPGVNERLRDNLDRLRDRKCDLLYPNRTPGIALVPDP